MKTQIPLLHDHHTHPLLYAAFLSAIDLSEVCEREEAMDLLAEASRNGDTDSIVVAHSWKDNFFDFTDDDLKKIDSCAIFNISLHKLLVNKSAEKTMRSRFGDYVMNVQNQDLYERHLRTVLNCFALLNGSPEALTQFYYELEKLGVWSAEEMLLVDACEIDWFEESELITRTRFWAAPETFESLSQDHKSKVKGLKLFADGAIGARTAAISSPYLKQPENFGLLIYSDEQLAEVLARCSDYSKAIAIHAIGDRAIEQVLTQLENCDSRKRFSEVRIEHAQLISIGQARRAKKMNVTLSMQPNFSLDSESYSDRLPAKFVEGNNPFRMLIDQAGFEPGIDLLFGSDGMPHGAQFAVEASMFSPLVSQRLTLDEFKQGYCGNEKTVEFTVWSQSSE